MTRKTTWSNSDGLVVGYGPNFPERQATADVKTFGYKKEAVMDFTYQSTAPALELPADSLVSKVYLLVTEAWNDGTSLAVGDGGDAGGWILAATLVEATLDNAAPQVFNADGLYAVPNTATDDVAAPAKLYATADTIDVAITGVFTSGKARLVVEYSTVTQ